MALNFELDDRDLAHFQVAMDCPRKVSEGKTDADIINRFH